MKETRQLIRAETERFARGNQHRKGHLLHRESPVQRERQFTVMCRNYPIKTHCFAQNMPLKVKVPLFQGKIFIKTVSLFCLGKREMSLIRRCGAGNWGISPQNEMRKCQQNFGRALEEGHIEQNLRSIFLPERGCWR